MRFALHKIIATAIKAKAMGNVQKEGNLKLLKMSRTQNTRVQQSKEGMKWQQ